MDILPTLVSLCKANNPEKKIDGVSYHITKWHDGTHFYKKIVIEDKAAAVPLIFTEKVAKFSLGDFNDMFAYHHMQIQEVYGNYALGNYDVKKSPRLVIIGRKMTK